jgi:hypothetical protein
VFIAAISNFEFQLGEFPDNGFLLLAANLKRLARAGLVGQRLSTHQVDTPKRTAGTQPTDQRQASFWFCLTV